MGLVSLGRFWGVFVCLLVDKGLLEESIKCKEVGGAKKKVGANRQRPSTILTDFFALLRSEVTSEALSLAKPLKSSLSRVSASPSDPQAARPIDCALSENNFHKHCTHFQAVLEHNGLDHHQQQ